MISCSGLVISISPELRFHPTIFIKRLKISIGCCYGNAGRDIHTFLDPFSGIKKQRLIRYVLGHLIFCYEHIPNSRLNNLVPLNISKEIINKLTIISDLKIKPMYIYSKMEEDKWVDFRFLNFTKIINEINKIQM